ncbi:MAG: hypothetical protein A3J24_09500 [Deltaproteobacteria bacterium RIFCSPLOWO2_02_FULL_53_8]|nr:MAG: hypothetical protein A3J24_09500 [Deltaproteobacteria bacterium RIFCSPLOWO2_02_FULL_53_8]
MRQRQLQSLLAGSKGSAIASQPYRARQIWIAVTASVSIHFLAIIVPWEFNKNQTLHPLGLAPSMVFNTRTLSPLASKDSSHRAATGERFESQKSDIQDIHGTQNVSASFERTNRTRTVRVNGTALAAKYLAFDEVTQPAEPVGEWTIDTESWQPGTHVSARFEIWISQSGAIDKWNLLGKSADDPSISEAFETIRDTLMNPATLNGTPVPSYRQLEIEISRE